MSKNGSAMKRGQSPVKKAAMSVVMKKSSVVYRAGTTEIADNCGVGIGEPISAERELGLQAHLVELEHLRTLNVEVTRERGVTSSVQDDVGMLRGQLGRANERIVGLEKVRNEQDANITQLEKVRGE